VYVLSINKYVLSIEEYALSQTGKVFSTDEHASQMQMRKRNISPAQTSLQNKR
jgi:hypothetical protein